MAGRIFEIAFNILGRVGPTFNQSFSNASDRMTQLNTRVSALKAEMKDLDAQQRKGIVSANQYSETYRKLSLQMAKAEQVQRNNAKATALQDKVNRARGNARMNMVGAVETAVVAGSPVAAAMDFEDAMSGVAKQVDGARSDAGQLTEVYFQAKGQVMQASKDMMIMPDTMAKAFAMAAKSGVQGMENIDKFARVGIMMGTAFEAPAEQITEDFAKIGSAMSIDLSTKEGIAQLEALGDTVNYLDDRSNASGADIIQVLKRIAGTATSLLPTVSRNTLAGMSTAMLQMGETSETAGTALNALFTKVAAAPTQSKSFQGALAQIGLTGEELQANALKDGEGTILNLFERIGQLDDASKNNVLAELFGAEHIDTLSKISGNYEKFVEVIKMGNSEAAKGSMMKEFAIQSENTSRQLEGMKASAARAAISFATVLLPDIKRVAGVASHAADWFMKLGAENESLANGAVRLGAAVLGGTVALSAMMYAGWAIISPFVSLYGWMTKIGAAQWLWTKAQWAWNIARSVGDGLLYVGRMIAFLGLMAASTVATTAWTAAQWLWNAAMTANPIGMLIVGIGALIGAGYLLIQNWDTVKVWWTQLWNDPAAAMQAFVDGIRARFGPTLAWLEEKWNRLSALFGGSGGGGSTGGMGGFKLAEANVMENAAGGIYGKGAFLTTFAERTPEAAIPLDGSPRALSLWSQAGEMLGVPSGSNSFEEYASSDAASTSGGNTFVFSPKVYLNGGDSGVVSQVHQAIREQADDFERRMDEFMARQRRTSFA